MSRESRQLAPAGWLCEWRNQVQARELLALGASTLISEPAEQQVSALTMPWGARKAGREQPAGPHL